MPECCTDIVIYCITEFVDTFCVINCGHFQALIADTFRLKLQKNFGSFSQEKDKKDFICTVLDLNRASTIYNAPALSTYPPILYIFMMVNVKEQKQTLL